MIISKSYYNFFIAAALVFNIGYILFNYRRYSLKLKDVLLMLIIENLFIVIGGKFFTYLDEFPKYQIKDIPSLWFTSYGNMLGAVLGITIYAFIFKKDLAKILMLGTVPLPLVYAIGKIGCFTAGCCYGINYEGFGKVIYTNSFHAPLNKGIFPIQLVEAIVFTIIFIVFEIKSHKQIKITDFAYLLLSIGLGKFFLDYLRAGRTNIILSFNQIISIFLIAGALFIIGKYYYKDKKTLKISNN